MYQKKNLEQKKEEELIANEHPYRVDGEVGRFTFTTHSLEMNGDIIYNAAGNIFTTIRGKDWYKTSGFKEIGLIYGATEGSYRKTEKLINRIRYQEGATPVSTLQSNAESEGTKIVDFMERKTTDILERNNFTGEGAPKNRLEEYMKNPVLLPEEEVKKAITACGLSDEEELEIEKNPVSYEDPEEAVNISIDDVIVKKQKAKRDTEIKSVEEKKEKKREYAHTTVAHIQKEEKSYTVNGYNVLEVLRIVIGFLLNNNLLKYRLQFFVDGQKTLQDTILRFFSWFCNIGIILDWYHLEDKCKRQLSLGLNGRHIRNDVLDKLMGLLWYGMVDNAIRYLESLGEDVLKNREALDVLIKYIERHRFYIPCYGVRKKLGLRNSSNIGEKMNDLIVSERQKHNGMSWSKNGSVALATIETLKRNKEYHKWFEQGDLELKLAA